MTQGGERLLISSLINPSSFQRLCRYGEVIKRLESKGFRIEAAGSKLRVNPAGKLTLEQRQWLQTHKRGLLTALLRRMAPHLADIADTFSVACVDRIPIDVDPWRVTRCCDCAHFKRADHPNLGHCAMGQPEAPAGLWDTDRRYCEQYQFGATP